LVKSQQEIDELFTEYYSVDSVEKLANWIFKYRDKIAVRIGDQSYFLSELDNFSLTVNILHFFKTGLVPITNDMANFLISKSLENRPKIFALQIKPRKLRFSAEIEEECIFVSTGIGAVKK